MPYVGKKPADIIATSVDTDTGTFSGNVTAGGTLGVTGAVTANAGVVVDNITIDGTEIDLSSGDLTLDVAGDISLDADGGNIVIKDGGTHFATLTNSSTDFVMKVVTSDKDIIFQGNDGGSGIEAARFDMSLAGMFLLGKTSSAAANKGVELHNTGSIVATVDGGTILYANRSSSYGDLVEFRYDNTDRGSIGIGSGNVLYVGGGDVFLAFFATGDSVYPSTDSGGARDNAIDLGTSSARFQTLYATTSSINTSDKNEKQDIEELTDAEKKVAVVAKGLLRKYRWKDAVAKKGDNARTHFGIIAQDLQDAFTAESLDASKYAMFCSDTWWEKEITVDAVEAVEEVKDEEGDVTTEAVEAKEAYTYMDNKYEATDGYTEKTRLGVRYNELLAFIISAI